MLPVELAVLELQAVVVPQELQVQETAAKVKLRQTEQRN
jgi:hypothetical protein